MWKILKTSDIEPAPKRSEITWSQFLHSQAAVACDFFTVDTALLRSCYVLFSSPLREHSFVIGGQFIDAFDEIFRTEGLKTLKTPVRTPAANAFAEQWTGPIRRELLDRTLI